MHLTSPTTQHPPYRRSDMVKLPERRAAEVEETLRTFCCAIPKVCIAAGRAAGLDG